MQVSESAKDERYGWLLIAASLSVIAVIAGLMIRSDRVVQAERNRTQGVSLVRLLSNIPIEQLVPDSTQRGPLQIVRTIHADSDFAYGVVVDQTGSVLREVVAPGIVTPQAHLPPDPASWVGERELVASNGASVLEFYAPVLSQGERVAHVRIGFRQPGWGPTLADLPMIGMLALPVFLLTPLAFFLIRRELRPISEACSQIRTRLGGDCEGAVTLTGPGQLGELVTALNGYVQSTEERVRDLERQQRDSDAASKVLAYQKSRIEAVLDTLPDATLLIDEAGSTTFANAKLQSLLGVPPENVLGKTAEEWCTSREVVEFLSAYRGSSPRKRRADTLWFSPDGQPDSRIAVSVHPLTMGRQGGGIGGILVVVRDATAAALEKRAQAEFITHVAHELKAPLQVIGSYNETLLEKDGDSAGFRIEACNVIQDEIERLATLVSTLLSVAQIEMGVMTLDRQRVRLHEFLHDALENISRGGKLAGITFDFEVPETISAIQLDKDLFRVALNNLLTNAIKYSDAGGHVTLLAEETQERLIISVRDAGIGIEEKDLGRVFDKFFRSDDGAVQRRSGHGLGLSLSKEIVELHGGTLQVESTPGEGSTFSIVFTKTPALVKEAL